MTVAELIELLRAHPHDAEVLVDGYEGGFDDPIVKVLLVGRRCEESNWDGIVEEAWSPERAAGCAVIVSREPRWDSGEECDSIAHAEKRLREAKSPDWPRRAIPPMDVDR